MNILIFGAGFVGSQIAKKLYKSGNCITVTTTSPDKVNELNKICNHVFLIDDESNFKELLKDQDLVIITIAPKSREGYKQAYLQTAQKIKEAIDESTTVRQLVYTSSTSVYGDYQGAWVNESQFLRPLNESQQILIDTEKVYLNHLPKSVQVCIFRLGEIYGEGRSIESRMRTLEDKLLPGTGENYTNLIHIQDILRAIFWSMERFISGVYNLCNDHHVTRKEFYQMWSKSLGLKDPQFDADQLSLHRGSKKVSNQKIKLEGFEFKHPHSEPLG